MIQTISEEMAQERAALGKLRHKLLYSKRWRIADVADEAIRQYERAERWKAVAEHALKSLNIYDDGDGNRLISMIDEQMLSALDEYSAAEAKEDDE